MQSHAFWNILEHPGTELTETKSQIFLVVRKSPDARGGFRLRQVLQDLVTAHVQISLYLQTTKAESV